MQIEEKTIYVIPHVRVVCGKIEGEWFVAKVLEVRIGKAPLVVAHAFHLIERFGLDHYEESLKNPKIIPRGRRHHYPIVKLSQKEVRQLPEIQQLYEKR